MDITTIYIPLLLVFGCAVNSKDMTCIKLDGNDLTWSDCLKTMDEFVDGLDTVFQGSNPMIWPPKTEAEVKDLCRIYETVSDHDHMQRTGVSPEMERYLNDGFHDMMEYILCEKDGIGEEYPWSCPASCPVKVYTVILSLVLSDRTRGTPPPRQDRGYAIYGYVHARQCLGDDGVRGQIKHCFEEYGNFNYSYNNIKASDARIREHCKIFKKYRQCRIDVFRNNCDSRVAEWNDRAFIEYYDKYAGEVHCNIDGGLTTAEIIYVVLGCIGGVLVLFCLCFIYSRFQNCSGSNSQIKNFFQAMSAHTNKKKQEEKKKKQEEKKKKKKEAQQSKGAAKKDAEKDVEAGKAKQNGEDKPVAEDGYYNIKELDNNSVNERKEEESGNDRRKDSTDEPDEPEEDERAQRRRDYKDSPGNPRRDYPRDYPRGPPREYPRGSPRDRYPRDYPRDYSPRSRTRAGPSYDDMFQARVHGGGPPPRNINDVRLMMKSRGPRRY